MHCTDHDTYRYLLHAGSETVGCWLVSLMTWLIWEESNMTMPTIYSEFSSGASGLLVASSTGVSLLCTLEQWLHNVPAQLQSKHKDTEIKNAASNPMKQRRDAPWAFCTAFCRVESPAESQDNTKVSKHSYTSVCRQLWILGCGKTNICTLTIELSDSPFSAIMIVAKAIVTIFDSFTVLCLSIMLFLSVNCLVQKYYDM